MYTGFLAIVMRLLAPGAELITITPRAFCNGPYFRPFWVALLDTMTIRRVHVFDARDRAFRDDQVLLENVIVHAVKGQERTGQVVVSSSTDPDDPVIAVREVPHDVLVRPDDPEAFIRIVPDDVGQQVAERMGYFTTPLAALGPTVSTGRVVDSRAEDYLRDVPGEGSVPLIYPTHLRGGRVVWPKPEGRKPNALPATPETADLVVPAGYYVLVKRFSAKEERRRVVASVYDPTHITASTVAFENQLNYYHMGGSGLPAELARGLAGFLNSTLVDACFRQFNGHTQVNATDLRSLMYPDWAELTALGARIGHSDLLPDQDTLDRIVEEELLHMAETPDPVRIAKRVEDARATLKDLVW